MSDPLFIVYHSGKMGVQAIELTEPTDAPGFTDRVSGIVAGLRDDRQPTDRWLIIEAETKVLAIRLGIIEGLCRGMEPHFPPSHPTDHKPHGRVILRNAKVAGPHV